MASPDPQHPAPSGKSGPRRIGDVLRARGVITQEQLDAALKHQGSAVPAAPLGEIIVKLGFATIRQVTEALALTVGIPFAVLTPGQVDPEALRKLPPEYLEQHNLLPLKCAENWLTIAAAQFTDVFLIEEIHRRTGCELQIIAAEPDNIRQTRAAVLNLASGTTAIPAPEIGGNLDEILSEISIDNVRVVGEGPQADDETLMAGAAESPVVKLVNYVLRGAIERGASDIHIEPEDPGFRVRYRIDGDLLETIRPTSRLLPAVVSRVKIMAGLDISERRAPQDGAMTVTLVDRPVDVRVSTMATKYGEKVVMRIIDRNSAIRTLDALGFEPAMLASFRAVTTEPNGIVLVTGPTGSGKTTTLYAALNEIVSEKENICTIEDPVERRLGGTNQFQVNPAAGFTFASAMRSMLRQDPDVIMVGEIRDAETARMATEAALTGHLVLSTLHTNDAITAVPRLINMGVEPYLVAASLRGVLAQRLVRRLCPHCREEHALNEAHRDILTALCGGTLPLSSASVAVGCPRCCESGFSGRVGIFELLLLTEELLSIVARSGGIADLRGCLGARGFRSMVDDGIDKLRAGLVTLDRLLQIVVRADERAPAEAPRRAAA